MATVELTAQNFHQVVQDSDMVIVDFWATWCAPCRNFAPIYEKVSQNHPDVVFGKVNTEEEQQLAYQFNIRSIPTLMIFREQIIIFSQAGSLPAPHLEDVINKAKGLNMEDVRAEIAKQQPQT